MLRQRDGLVMPDAHADHSPVLRLRGCSTALHTFNDDVRTSVSDLPLRESPLQEELKHGRAQQHRTELQRQMAAHEEAALAERAARAAEARSVLVRSLMSARPSLDSQKIGCCL